MKLDDEATMNVTVNLQLPYMKCIPEGRLAININRYITAPTFTPTCRAREARSPIFPSNKKIFLTPPCDQPPWRLCHLTFLS